MTMLRSRRLLGLGTVAAALSLGLMPGVVGAVHEGDYPGHIHTGSCETLGEVVFPLNNARVGGMMMDMMGEMATPEGAMAMGEEMGSEARIPVATSVTVLDVALEDILAAEHAINYHESEDNMANYIACGDIGGAVMTMPGMGDDGTLVIGLRSLNDSGIAGVATLQGMGDQTQVAVFLGEDLTGLDDADAGTPAA